MPKPQETWLNTKWRPMMSWMYMLVCTMDFVVFPVLWSLVQVWGGGRVETQWSPITLQGAGLFHMAMGAILGVAAFGRTQEKLAGITDNNSGFSPDPGVSLTPSSSPAYNMQPKNDRHSATDSFNPVYRSAQPIATTAGGKKIVPIDDEPLI